MGLFDYVRLNEPVACPTCGTPHLMCQTKDRPAPWMETYTEDQLDEAEIDNFGFWCSACQTSVNFYRRVTKEQGNRAAFDMEVEVFTKPSPSLPGEAHDG